MWSYALLKLQMFPLPITHTGFQCNMPVQLDIHLLAKERKERPDDTRVAFYYAQVSSHPTCLLPFLRTYLWLFVPCRMCLCDAANDSQPHLHTPYQTPNHEHLEGHLSKESALSLSQWHPIAPRRYPPSLMLKVLCTQALRAASAGLEACGMRSHVP